MPHQRLRRHYSTILALCAGLAGLLPGLAAFDASAHIVIASDDFNSYTAGNSLNGGAGGTGWAGAWSSLPTGVVLNTTPGAGAAGDDPMSGKAVGFNVNNNTLAQRFLATTQSGNVIAEYKFQLNAGNATSNDFFSLWFNGLILGPAFGLKADCGHMPDNPALGTCAPDLFVRTGGIGGQYVENVAVGLTYTLMAYLQKTGGSPIYNRFDLWVDPTPSERQSLTGWDRSFGGLESLAQPLSSISSIGFRAWNLGASDAILVDDLSLSLPVFSTVPEPGTLALVGLALVGFAGAARRRRTS